MGLRLDYCIPKERFLAGLSFIYLFAFASLYIQLPGLYGDNGILPVRLLEIPAPSTLSEFVQHPNLLGLSSMVGIDAYHLLELIIIVGFVLSCLSGLSTTFRILPVYLALWLIYYSAFKVGQTFLWFQWDILLLEAGFIAVVLAKVLPGGLLRFVASDRLGMFLVRWLLFRLMFSAGVVKLTSGCPAWWGLEALHWHYQSQCIPSPLAWFAHWLPGWFHKLCVASTLLIEIILPLLFVFTHQSIRIFSFYAQVLLQVMIIATGNYNFFNMLTIVLCYSLLKDGDFPGKRRCQVNGHRCADLLSHCIVLTVIGASVYYFLNITFDANGLPDFSLNLNPDQFSRFVSFAVPASLYVALALFVIEVIRSIYDALRARSVWRKVVEFMGVVLVGLVALTLLFNSAVPYSNLDRAAASKLPVELTRLHQQLRDYQLGSSYGLFRRITGVGGRPELVLEASSSEDGPWVEYEFRFKPGRLDRSPPIIVPHQPRLDWQMWFAALSNPEKHHWLYNLIYRLLQQQPDVLELLDTSSLPRNPKYIRAILYTYHYTSQRTDKNWWKRSQKSVYLPPMSLSSTGLQKMIQETGITKRLHAPKKANSVVDILTQLRSYIGQPADLCPMMLVLVVVWITKYAVSQASQTAVESGRRKLT